MLVGAYSLGLHQPSGSHGFGTHLLATRF